MPRRSVLDASRARRNAEDDPPVHCRVALQVLLLCEKVSGAAHPACTAALPARLQR
jgi:hypothetical protein